MSTDAYIDELRRALTELIAAEDATIDKFGAGEIDRLERAMHTARKVLAQKPMTAPNQFPTTDIFHTVQRDALAVFECAMCQKQQPYAPANEASGIDMLEATWLGWGFGKKEGFALCPVCNLAETKVDQGRAEAAPYLGVTPGASSMPASSQTVTLES